MKNTLTPGVIELDDSSLSHTKENVRIDALIPPDILHDKTKLREFLEAYYSFMNMDEFIYQETKTFSDVIADNVARFRIPDPTGDGNEFFTDDDGANSTLTLTSPSGFSPAKHLFDASSSSVTLTATNKIAVGDFFQLAAPIGTLLTYDVGDGTAIGGLIDDNNYYVVYSAAGEIKLSLTSGGSIINLTAVGSGKIHSFKGAAPTMTIPLANTNVQISNGNDLPGTLATITSEIGKTFSVSGLNSFNGYSASISTIVKSWVGPGPSNVMNTIEKAMDIDRNTSEYLELMQKEIAEAIPRDVTSNKRTLYKQMVDFYKLRGTSDSIEIFFRLLFNDSVEVETPYDNTFIPSEGDWDQKADITVKLNGAINNSATVVLESSDENILAGATFISGTTYTRVNNIRITAVSGRTLTLDTAITLPDDTVCTIIPRGTWLNNKSFPSNTTSIIHDSKRYQKFSYLIKTGKNLSDWEYAFDKLVHPAGFVYFAEILIFLELTKAIMGEDEFNTDDLRFDGLSTIIRKVMSAIPTRQPGVIGPEDIPLLVEIFLSMFLPQTTANIHRSGTLSLTLKNGVIHTSSITSGGTGYIAAPVLVTSDAAAASGFTTATITTGIANGSVNAITISEGGENYGDPQATIAAPPAITFNPATAVNLSNDTITLTTAQAAALNNGDVITYNSGGGSSIANLVSTTAYKVVNKSGNNIKLELASNPAGAIDLGSVGSGTSHTLTGTTATATLGKLDGKVKSIEIGEKGFGYASGPLTISFNGDAQQGITPIVPQATIGITSNGELDKDAITISNQGGGYSNLFATVPANPNVTKVAGVSFSGPNNKRFKTAPAIVFPEPTAKDALGAALSTNVTATGTFTIAAADNFSDADNPIHKGEITGVNITNVGSGYVLDPIVTISSAVQNEIRAKDQSEITELSLNHNDIPTGEFLITQIKTNPRQTTGSVMLAAGDNLKFLPESRVDVVNANFRTIINNNSIQRKGQAFYNSSRLYQSNQTIGFLSDIQLSNVDSTYINKYNTRTFVDIE